MSVKKKKRKIVILRSHSPRLSKSPSSEFIWRGTKDFSYLISTNLPTQKWSVRLDQSEELPRTVGDKAVTHKY